MKIPEKYCCDICKKELTSRGIKRKIYVSTNCDWTEGRPTEPHIELITADVCDDCLLKGTNFVADFQESNLRLYTSTWNTVDPSAIRCDACGCKPEIEYTSYGTDKDLPGNTYSIFTKRPKFCPSCGARMLNFDE